MSSPSPTRGPSTLSAPGHNTLCTDNMMLYLCRTDSYNSAAWCATAVDPGGNVVTNRCLIISSHVPTTHVSWPGGVTVTPPGARWRLPGAARLWGARAWASPASSPSQWTGRPITSARSAHCIESASLQHQYHNECCLQLGKVKTGCSSILLWGFITVETCKVSTRANFITNTRKLLKLIIMKLCPV